MSKIRTNNNKITNQLKSVLKTLDLRLEEELIHYQLNKLGQTNLLSKSITSEIIEIKSLNQSYQSLTETPMVYQLKLPNLPQKSTENILLPSPKHTGVTIVNQSSSSDPNSLKTISPSKKQLNNYLPQSSEIITSEAQDTTTPEEKWFDSLLTPLGIFSILLVTISSGLLGSTIVTSEIFKNTFFSQLSQKNQHYQPQTIKNLAQNQPISIPNGENLNSNQSEKFINLELGNITNLQPNQSASPNTNLSNSTNQNQTLVNSTITNDQTTTSAQNNHLNPAITKTTTPVQPSITAPPLPSPQTNQDLASALLPPSIRPELPQPENLQVSQVTQSTTTSTPSSNTLKIAPPPPPKAQIASKPNPTPPSNVVAQSIKPNAIPAPKTTSYYHVVIDYLDESSLKQAQTIVKEAYLIEFPEGVKIQMGVFDQEKDATILAEQLLQQGFNAYIYYPN